MFTAVKRAGTALLSLPLIFAASGFSTAHAASTVSPRVPANYSRQNVVNPDTGGSCTGYYSDTTPPSSIRVYRAALNRIDVVDFESYVENSLPKEWVPSWAPASLQAGAMAIKTYAWYWVNHWRGGSLGGACYDVDDTTNYLVYQPGSAVSSTNAAVAATWDTVMTESGSIFETSFCSDMDCAEPPAQEYCGQNADGTRMSQVGSEACAVAGQDFLSILSTYYYPSLHFASLSAMNGGWFTRVSSSVWSGVRVGSGGHVYQSAYNAGWRTYGLGGTLSGTPAIVYRSGRTDVFALAPSGDLWQDTYSGGSWGGWHQDGSVTYKAGTGISAIYADGMYRVYGAGPDGALWESYYSDAWHSESLGGSITGTPGVTYVDGRYDVFALVASGDLWQITYSNGWGNWHQDGTVRYKAGTGVSAVYADGRYRVYGVGPDSAVWESYYSDAWHSQSLGGTLTGTPSVTFLDGRYDVFGLAPDRSMWQITYQNGWGSWHQIADPV